MASTVPVDPVDPCLLSRLHQHFDALPDPRVARTRLHPLKDILLLAVAAVLCLADGYEPMQRWAHIKGVQWLRSGSERTWAWLCPMASRTMIPSGACCRTCHRICWRPP